jgi:hypothetical protein
MWLSHAYPQQLASFVYERWQDIDAGFADDSKEPKLPVLPLLESLLSTAYQASLLREEEHPLLFRLILAEPEDFSSDDGPPSGVHRLQFDEYVEFSPNELKALVHAATFERSLLGIKMDKGDGYQIWGIVHSGPRWLHAQHGGRGSPPSIPPALVVNVTGPGCLEVCKGSIVVGQLSYGRVFGPSTNILASHWMQELFAQTRAERMELHSTARENAGAEWGELDPELTHIIDQHMMKRMLAAIRAFRHGGTLIMIPPERTEELVVPNPYINIKYKFTQGEPRARFRTLIVAIMNSLASSTISGGSEKVPGAVQEPARPISWEDYQLSSDATIAALDEAIFEVSHLIAALSTVDGAVIMTRRFELLGFGAEIRLDVDNVSTVARAVDLEGQRFKTESTRGIGTRHRSAYNLCHKLHDVLAVVISQDGGVRFIRWNADHVMYWDHQATFAFSQRF